MSTTKLVISLVDSIFNLWEDKNKNKYKERYLKLLEMRDEAINEIPQDHAYIDSLDIDIVRFAEIFGQEVRSKIAKNTRK